MSGNDERDQRHFHFPPISAEEKARNRLRYDQMAVVCALTLSLMWLAVQFTAYVSLPFLLILILLLMIGSLAFDVRIYFAEKSPLPGDPKLWSAAGLVAQLIVFVLLWFLF